MCIANIYEAAAAVGTGFGDIISCSSSTFGILNVILERHCVLC